MPSYQLPDGRTVSDSMAFQYNGIQYPENWIRLSTQDERESLGLVALPEPQWYDERFYWAPGQPKELEGLQSEYIGHVRRNVASLLSDTDWYLVRETDTGVPCPLEVRAWRQSLRDAAATKSAAINAAITSEELAAYIISPGTITVDAETGEETIDATTAYSYWPPAPAIEPQQIIDYRLFYDALLVSPAYATIRSKAVTNASVLTACVEFISAIGDAKAGRPNPPAIQACVDLLCAAANFTPMELADLAEVMAACGLDQLYTLPAD